MLILNQTTSAGQSGLNGIKKGKESRSRGVLDTFRGRYEKLDVHLGSAEYQNVPDLAAAKMLGHFTQTMQNQGYPWRLHAADPAPGEDGFKKGESVGDLEALQRLKKGEGVLMQPMRDLQLDLSSGSLTALAAAGTLAGAQAGTLSTVAEASKNTQVSAGSQGFSVKFGEPLVINSIAELKLLNQMYDSEQKVEGATETAKAAHQFAYFTQKTIGSAYPWRFYTKDDGNTALRVAKSTAKGLLSGAAVGGVVAGAVGALLALGFRNWNYLTGAAGIGAAIGAARGGYDAARTSLKGNPVNAVEALERVISGEEVVFQESRTRSVGLPIVGKIAWFSDHGKGSSVKSVDDLNTFYYMQSGAELPKAPEPKKEEKPAAPSVVVIDQSVHHNYQANDFGLNIIGNP